MAYELDEALFWDLTPPERGLVFERRMDIEKRRSELFGLVAAEVYNSVPRKSKRAKQPGDYFKAKRTGPPVTEEDRRRLEHLMAPTGSIRA